MEPESPDSEAADKRNSAIEGVSGRKGVATNLMISRETAPS
jgi:hypothetical protein